MKVTTNLNCFTQKFPGVYVLRINSYQHLLSVHELQTVSMRRIKQCVMHFSRSEINFCNKPWVLRNGPHCKINLNYYYYYFQRSFALASHIRLITLYLHIGINLNTDNIRFSNLTPLFTFILGTLKCLSSEKCSILGEIE